MVWNQALAQSTVPKISVVIRKSIGAAYGNMCGPGMGADFVVAWPTAEINFTGPEVGVNVVYGRQLQQAEDPQKERQALLEGWAFDSSPYKAAGKHLLDDVIDPRDTRKFICRTLEFSCAANGGKANAAWQTGRPGFKRRTAESKKLLVNRSFQVVFCGETPYNQLFNEKTILLLFV
nr:carboxyl transferase domain-containing protein [Planococcus glaciei]